jgi:predicted ester cyclase
LICDPPHVASRLRFDCRPKGLFLDLPVNGTRVNFAENVFYQFRDERIAEVWSVIDKGAIEAQL